MDRPVPELPGVQHRWIDAGGLRMHVAEAGEGPPLLLVHGWPQHWWMWRGVIPRLAEHHRLICPDLRGHGWTDAPPSGYDKGQMSSDLLALLDALGLERVGYMGHDWGGFIGYLLALRSPERIERLIALNTGHPFYDPSLRRALSLWRFWYAAVLGTPVVGQRLLTSGQVGRALRHQLVPRSWSPAEADVFLDQWREPERARATSAVYRAFVTTDARALAAGRYRGRRLEVPTLVLHGTLDPVLPVETQADLPEHADDARVEPVEGVTHFIVDEVPELVAERARAFFA
jgi:pimeloyl-ACP methyl ester carboxylesterase